MPTNDPQRPPAHPDPADTGPDPRSEEKAPGLEKRRDPAPSPDTNQSKRGDPPPTPEEKRSKLADGGGADEQGGGTQEEEHEGGTDTQVGDRTGPGAGYDREPEQVKDRGGVS